MSALVSLRQHFRKHRRSTDVQPSALQQPCGSFGALNSRDPASARRLEMLAQPFRSFEILPGLHLLSRSPSRSSQ